MGFTEAINTCFSKYVTFTGRAARPEYWYFVLFVFIVDLVLQLLERTPISFLAMIANVVFSLAVLLPSIAVGIRRLHDIDRSGWWLLIGLVPIVGVFVLLIWACTPGTPGANRFG